MRDIGTLYPLTRPLLLLLCAVIAAAQDRKADEPLCRAALYGDLAQLPQLLAAGANPNVRDGQDNTPLMHAASVLGHIAVRDHVP